METSNHSSNTGGMKLKDKKVSIWNCTYDSDPKGYPIEEWAKIHDGQLWAYYRQLSGTEYYAAAAQQNTEEVMFAINWRVDVEPQMLVEYNGKYYEIVRVDNYEGYKRDIRLYCKLTDHEPE